jgi:hypothetical protein
MGRARGTNPGRPTEVRSNEQSEAILPAQHPDTTDRGLPERRLLWAVLGQALRDLALVRATTASLPPYRRACGRCGANVKAWSSPVQLAERGARKRGTVGSTPRRTNPCPDGDDRCQSPVLPSGRPIGGHSGELTSGAAASTRTSPSEWWVQHADRRRPPARLPRRPAGVVRDHRALQPGRPPIAHLRVPRPAGGLVRNADGRRARPRQPR